MSFSITNNYIFTLRTLPFYVTHINLNTLKFINLLVLSTDQKVYKVGLLKVYMIKLFSCFAGYGTDNFALKQLGIDFECVGFRKDIDKGTFQFPEKEELKIFIKDILENEPVDNKFYLKEHQVNKLLEALAKKNNNFQSRRFQKNIASTLAARDYKDPKIVDIQSIQWDSTGKGHHSQPDRAYSVNGVAPCLQAQGTSEKAKIFALRSYPMTGSKEQDGERFQNPEFREDGCSNTLTAVEKDNLLSISPTLTTAIGRQGSSTEFMSSCESVLKSTGIFRRLTPKECFRLQGFLNDEINLEGLSDTQCYKLVGNGQSVNVVKLIFSCMFKRP
jgi:DNA (cytosine-5)-methyltransferase 1